MFYWIFDFWFAIPFYFLVSYLSGVAQWLACWAHNPKVRGSKPRSASCLDMVKGCCALPRIQCKSAWFDCFRCFHCGGKLTRILSPCHQLLAHSLRSLVAERQTCNLKVLGSIPSEGFHMRKYEIFFLHQHHTYRSLCHPNQTAIMKCEASTRTFL